MGSAASFSVGLESPWKVCCKMTILKERTKGSESFLSHPVKSRYKLSHQYQGTIIHSILCVYSGEEYEGF